MLAATMTATTMPSRKDASDLARDPARSLEDNQWLPPNRMRSYAIARAIGGAIFAAIFIGWIFIQWSSPAMRIIGSGLVLITGWVTTVSIVRDARRAAGRQITAKPGALEITNVQHYEGTQTIRMSEVGEARWLENTSDDFGLWFYDQQGEVLVHLDANFLDGQSEARSFMGWVRERMDVPFKVNWPIVDV